MPSFLDEEEKKEIGGNYFKWTDGKEYHLIVKKGWLSGFAKANGYALFCENQDDGTKFELKWQFALLNAIDALGDTYAEDKVLTIKAHFGGTKPSKDGTKTYEIWNFDVSLFGAATPKTESVSVPF